MNDKNYFDDFRKSYTITGKYYDLGTYMKSEGYSSYLFDKKSTLEDFLGYYKTKKPKEREETSQEREARLLKEKAQAREVKIDLILKK
jgi:hypothetical protein